MRDLGAARLGLFASGAATGVAADVGGAAAGAAIKRGT